MKDTIWEALITENPRSEANGSHHKYLIHVDCESPSSDILPESSGTLPPDFPDPGENKTDSNLAIHFSTAQTNHSSALRNRYADKTMKNNGSFKRLVKKSGGLNFKVVNVEDKGERYIGDFFTTLVDVRWRWTLLYFTFSYVFSWFAFALIWWVIVRGHGDMDHFEEEGWTPCVVGVKSFSSIFLFSLETQHTIGYGYHRMSDECSEAIFLLIVQSIIGVIIEALTVGVFIVKLSRSKKRTQTLVFSKYAVIHQQDDGTLCLQFRVADVGKSLLLEAHMRAQIISKTFSKSGKVLFSQQAIELEADDQDEDRLLLFWPTTISHEINEESPLYSKNAQSFTNLMTNNFELVVVLEGIVESTGMTTQARTSYLPSEILWGRKFHDMFDEGNKHHTADMGLFHATYPTEMPTKSAEELNQAQHNESTDTSNGVL